MEVLRELKPLGLKTSVALGYFDGMHRGHSEIMRQTVAYAKSMHLKATVFTFDFSRVRPGEKGNRDLFKRSIIYEKMEQLGIDVVVEIPFEEIRNMTGRGFIANVLGHKCLNAAVISCGEDFRFGKGRDSDVEVMRILAGPHGIQVNVVPYVMDEGIISTTRIKRLIENGDTATASRLLGYSYIFEAKTVEQSTGVGINYSSVCQLLDESLLRPKFGVYTSRCLLEDGLPHSSVTYIGTRPTKHNTSDVYADSNIFSLEGDRYNGKSLRVELLKMMRSEEKFHSLSELKDAILTDIERAKMYSREK